VFGGAGGQHACALARRLGVRKILFHPLAGVLSAFGMGLADVSWHGEVDAGIENGHELLEKRARAALGDRLRMIRRVDIRYRNTERPITLAAEPAEDLRQRFEAEHTRVFGYARPEHAIEMERDAWILVAAELPEQMPALLALKRAQIDDPAVTVMYVDLVTAAEWDVDDPRLLEVADRLVAMFERDADEWIEDQAGDFAFDPDLVALLDEVFIDAVPYARRLLRLLEERGWRGWTQLERIGRPS
jgi:N-methylhydantoinase A/oxoprolinase/acetone carboxylase beta subunit